MCNVVTAFEGERRFIIELHKHLKLCVVVISTIKVLQLELGKARFTSLANSQVTCERG